MVEGVDREEALSWVLCKLSAARKAPAIPKVVLAPAVKKKELTEKKAKEYELWLAWKKGGQQPAHLDPLLKSLAPLIQTSMNTFRRAEVPTSTTEMEHKKELVKALREYDPNKGTALQTFIVGRMQKVSRYVNQNKTFVYSPENVTSKIGAYNAFKAQKTEQLGYEPDDQKLHDLAVQDKHPKLGIISLKEIKRLNRDQRKGLIQQGHEDDIIHLNKLDPRELEVIDLIKFQLTDEERKVHELTFGLNGNKAMKPGEIAKKLKMDNSKVSKLRTSAFSKMKPYLNE
jgi:DNA-directed RNA polymerase specialized sigma subunit